METIAPVTSPLHQAYMSAYSLRLANHHVHPQTYPTTPKIWSQPFPAPTTLTCSGSHSVLDWLWSNSYTFVFCYVVFKVAKRILKSQSGRVVEDTNNSSEPRFESAPIEGYLHTTHGGSTLPNSKPQGPDDRAGWNGQYSGDHADSDNQSSVYETAPSSPTSPDFPIPAISPIQNLAAMLSTTWFSSQDRLSGCISHIRQIYYMARYNYATDRTYLYWQRANFAVERYFVRIVLWGLIIWAVYLFYFKQGRGMETVTMTEAWNRGFDVPEWVVSHEFYKDHGSGQKTLSQMSLSGRREDDVEQKPVVAEETVPIGTEHDEPETYEDDGSTTEGEVAQQLAGDFQTRETTTVTVVRMEIATSIEQADSSSATRDGAQDTEALMVAVDQTEIPRSRVGADPSLRLRDAVQDGIFVQADITMKWCDVCQQLHCCESLA